MAISPQPRDAGAGV